MNDKRKLLKTGVFGVMDKGDKFVVAGDILVYQDGEFDYVSDVNENLCLKYRKIEKLVECKSYGGLQRAIDGKINCPIIYDRKKEETPVEMTVAEIEAKLGIKNLKIVKEN